MELSKHRITENVVHKNFDRSLTTQKVNFRWSSKAQMKATRLKIFGIKFATLI